MSTGPSASAVWAEFATGLRLQDIPAEVQSRALQCLADALACGVQGSALKWTQAFARQVMRQGSQGPCELWGHPGRRTSAAQAAMANGASVHAFEQDSLRFPGAGVHPGAALVPPLVAVSQETGASPESALVALVAGCEVLFRLGQASRHSSEKLGFHAPGLTGVYGSAVVAGLLYGLHAKQLQHALGIAGSMSAGLLAFSKATHGTAVKRMHMGRACEAGVVAAQLAQEGMTGPETILEGRFGFLQTYCREADVAALTQGLGEDWQTLRVCLKRYPCHVTAQAAMQALCAWKDQHPELVPLITHIELECADKVVSHHDIRDPADIMQAQYSVAFCIALALHHDPLDPSTWGDAVLSNAKVRATCQAVSLRAAGDLPHGWAARIHLRTQDGRQWHLEALRFTGMPDDPMGPSEQKRRFVAQCASLGSRAVPLFDDLMRLPHLPRFPEIHPT